MVPRTMTTNERSHNRYIQKFYQMRTQLQAISLRIQVGDDSQIMLVQALTIVYPRPSEAMSR
jgi:hypothetical protein